MRINKGNKSIDMEKRDANYILAGYIISYLFHCQNEDPERIIIPMYPSVPHPRKPGVAIPIEYVPPDSLVAVDIEKDGSNVAEATEEQIKQADEREDEIKRLKEEIEKLRTQESKMVESGALAEEVAAPASAEVSPARAAFAEVEKEPDITSISTPPIPTVDRKPKQPPRGTLPPGTPLDDMQSRNARLDKMVARDIAPQPDVDEEEEIPVEIEKPKE